MSRIRPERGAWRNLKKLFAVIAPYKWLVIIGFLVILIGEATAVGERFIFKYLIDEGTTYAAGSISREVFADAVLALTVAFLILLTVRALTRWFREYFVQQAEANAIADLKRKFFNHIIGLSLRFHTTHKTGTLISRLSRGGRALEDLMDVGFYNVAPAVFQLIIAAASLAYVSMLSAVIIVLTFMTLIVFSVWIERLRFKARLAANDADDMEKANIGDILTNIESVKYFAKERNVAQKYRGLSENSKRAMLRSWNYSKIQNVGQAIILGLGVMATLYFPLQSFLAGEITIGTLVFVYTIFIGLLSPIFSFIGGMRSFSRSIADFESLYEYEDEHNEIRDAAGAQPLHVRKGIVEFKDVGFTYTNRKILDGLSFTARKGEKVAIVGPSGAGKSTIIKLLYRLYDIDSGTILIDGVDISHVQQESLRSEMSIVPQEAVLFDDTIYNNILFSRPTATKEEVLQAMRFAQLDKIVATFPQGIDTVVGERGIKLSGGEKQRVSIARAILADKRILVLDEATSSLDSETESEIQHDLQQLMKGRTSIIIAHRLSTIMSADKIIVIENGRVTQQGTHKQLIRQKGRYRKLWELQKGGYIR